MEKNIYVLMLLKEWWDKQNEENHLYSKKELCETLSSGIQHSSDKLEKRKSANLTITDCQSKHPNDKRN